MKMAEELCPSTADGVEACVRVCARAAKKKELARVSAGWSRADRAVAGAVSLLLRIGPVLHVFQSNHHL